MAEKTIKEIRDHSEKMSRIMEMRQMIQQAMIRIIDPEKGVRRSNAFNVFSKERLRTFQKNPKTNEQSFRELSQFLYRMSYPFRRLIQYNAHMIDLTAYSVIPMIDVSKEADYDENDRKRIMKKYTKTLKQIRKMKLHSEIMKCLIIAWREDAFYGYTYEDDEDFFIMPLPGRYCRISSINFDGTLNFEFDFSYFRSYPEDLEFWDEEFKTKYELFVKNPINYKWQELDHNRELCLKINIDDIYLIHPPFAPLFDQIIDLIDLQSIQAVKDELSVYKLLVARLETLSGASEPDDFSVDVDTAIDYYNRLVENLPDYVSSAISPLKIDPIEFKGNTTEDVDMISNSMSNLFKSAGVSQLLDNDRLTGDSAFNAAILCDSMMAIKVLLPQIEKWHNRYLNWKINNACPIKYLEVTPYIKAEEIEKYKVGAQYGVPVKIAYATLLGFDPLEILSLTYLETDCLDLSRRWTPLQSSHTQSGTVSDDNKVNRVDGEPDNKTAISEDEEEGDE